MTIFGLHPLELPEACSEPSSERPAPYYDLTVAMVSIVRINVIYPSSKWTEMGGH
jgi:hypothetical protein